MTREDIIRMAREAGILETLGYGNAHMRAWQDDVVRELTHFAALVAAAEREALEKIDWTVLMRQGGLVTWGDAETLGDHALTPSKQEDNHER